MESTTPSHQKGTGTPKRKRRRRGSPSSGFILTVVEGEVDLQWWITIANPERVHLPGSVSTVCTSLSSGLSGHSKILSRKSVQIACAICGNIGALGVEAIAPFACSGRYAIAHNARGTISHVQCWRPRTVCEVRLYSACRGERSTAAAKTFMIS